MTHNLVGLSEKSLKQHHLRLARDLKNHMQLAYENLRAGNGDITEFLRYVEIERELLVARLYRSQVEISELYDQRIVL